MTYYNSEGNVEHPKVEKYWEYGGAAVSLDKKITRVDCASIITVTGGRHDFSVENGTRDQLKDKVNKFLSKL